MSEKIVIGLEAQIPFHNRKTVDAFIDFVSSYQPDRIVCIGDYLDCPAPARWNRGTAAEYAGKLQKEVNTAKSILGEIRDVFSGKFDYHIGNHEDRIETYAITKAPAFADLDCLKVASLLEFDQYDITQLPTYARLAPGWFTTHGDKPKASSRYAAGTAIALGRRRGVSLIAGHTHKQGIIRERFGQRTITGVEVGHMMATEKASYTDTPNWASGWVVVEAGDHGVHVELVGVSKSGQVTFRG